MLDKQFLDNACIELGARPGAIPYNLPFTDTRIALANLAVKQFMADPENRRELHERKQEYLHNKGWSQGRSLKTEYCLPQKAYLLLPQSMRQDRDQVEIKRWIRDHHPYLMYKSL